MKLWHCVGARSARCLWTLHELGAARVDACKLVTMPFPPRMHHKEYLQTNVLGTVPHFEDECGVTMTESVGICLYLAQKYRSPLAVRPSKTLHSSLQCDPANLCMHALQLETTDPEYASFLNWLFHADATLTFPQTVVLRYTKQVDSRSPPPIAEHLDSVATLTPSATRRKSPKCILASSRLSDFKLNRKHCGVGGWCGGRRGSRLCALV
eukprot:SAG11_NODE_5685_length_1487_cov_1.321326_1_plen_209_part_10